VLLRADGQARRGPLHEEGGEFFAVHLGEDGEEIGEARVRDELLRSVQDEMFAVRRGGGPGLDREGVRAGGGLRQGIGGEALSGRKIGEVPRLLLRE